METVIRDVIHGDIVITDPLITRLIDTKEFQRLRNIKQLSTASITFPGAEHTRFSHSIGVYHLAKTIGQHLESHPEWTTEKTYLASISGLLHDIGHGAFSHTFETLFGTDHEAVTCEILTSPETEIYHVLESYRTNFSKEVADSWLHLSDATVLQKTLSTLDQAYKNFFKKPDQFEKPKFKSRKHRSQSFTGRVNKQKSGKTSVYVAGPRYIYVPKLGFIKTSKTTRINGQIKEYTIIRESFGDYYISFQTEEPNRELLVKTKQLMGGDLGLTHLLTLSNGLKFPKFSPGQTLTLSLKAQSKASKSMNRNSKILNTKELIYLIETGVFDENKYDVSDLFDFKNHEKRMKKSAKAQRKVANKRHDHLHKLTTALVKAYDVIVLEDLNVKNMLKNHKLAKAISNASWATFVRFLHYKCEWYGKLFILIPPHYTSRICHQCGWDSGKKPLDIRKWTCPHCHETHDRDINAAINILYRGLETYLQSQLMLLNEQIKNGYFSTVFFQVASQWLIQTITYFNQALEIA